MSEVRKKGSIANLLLEKMFLESFRASLRMNKKLLESFRAS